MARSVRRLSYIDINALADLDPAEKVLRDEEDAKRRRKQDETRIALEKIQQRVNLTLNNYEQKDKETVVEYRTVSFKEIEDPVLLYDLLADSRMRARYEKHLMVVLVGFEEHCQLKESVLLSIDEFFQQTKASNTENFLAEVEAEKLDFDSATQGLESALETANGAAQKLVSIKKEIGQLLSVASSYPDTKKGKKKLEKALVSAQEQVHTLSRSIEALEKDLDQSKEKCDQLAKSLEAKATECLRLRKKADEAKKIQDENVALQANVKQLSESLDIARKQVQDFQQVVVDDTRVKELEQTLEELNVAHNELKAVHEKVEKDHKEMMNIIIKSEEERLEQAKAEYEEQLQNMSREILTCTTANEALMQQVLELQEVLNDQREELQLTKDEHAVNAEEQIRGQQEASDESHKASAIKLESPKVSDTDDAMSQAIAGLMSKHTKAETALREQMADKQVKYETAMQQLQNELYEAQRSNEKDRLSLQSEISTLEENLEDHKGQVKNLEQAIEQLVKEKEDSSTIFKQQELKITELETSLLEAQAKIEEQSREKSSLVSGLQTPPKQRDCSSPIKQIEPLSPHCGPLGQQQQQLQTQFASRSTQWSDKSNSGSTTPRHHKLVSMEEVDSPSASPQSAPSPKVIKPALPQPPVRPITSEHPLVSEWTKGYKEVMRFKDKVTKLMRSLNITVDEGLDKKGCHLPSDDDIQGSVTQMRFHLTLTLHQLESTLQESMLQLQQAPKVKTEEMMAEEKELQARISNLHQLMESAEEQHRSEVRDKQNTIANQSTEINSLKAEIISLRKHMQDKRHDEGEVIFFTRLDAERNEKALHDSLSTNTIDTTDYKNISNKTEEYLSIPPQQLGHLTHKLKQQTNAKSALDEVQHLYSPEHVNRVMGLMQQMNEKRQQDYATAMTDLSYRRTHLAVSLQSALTKVEKKTGLFLIKPIYPIRRYSRSLVVPLSRTPPVRRTPRRETPTPHHSTTLDLLHTPALTADISPARTGHSSVSTPTWSVTDSRLQSATPSFSPVLPRLVELETSPLRRPDTLLKSCTRAMSAEKESRKWPSSKIHVSRKLAEDAPHVTIPSFSPDETTVAH